MSHDEKACGFNCNDAGGDRSSDAKENHASVSDDGRAPEGQAMGRDEASATRGEVASDVDRRGVDGSDRDRNGTGVAPRQASLTERVSETARVTQINVPAVAPIRKGNHVHSCPECYEDVPCDYACSTEHDLTLDDGTPRGAYVVCDACKIRKQKTSIACRTWGAEWRDEYMQYSYDRGVFEGAAILDGLVGMGLAIRGRPTATDSRFVDIVHAYPPGPDSSFVEVENEDGRGMKLGEWIERQDGVWVLRIWRHDFEAAMPEQRRERAPATPRGDGSGEP
jgi:hypothetical protein